MPAPVIIVDYNPRWPAQFVRYSNELWSACGSLLEHVVHIGSTSVPGLAAKPIIDILVGVASPDMLDVRAEPVSTPGDGQNVTPVGPQEHVRVVEAIKTLGYVYRGENTIPGRLLFGHRDIKPPCHIHMVQTGSRFWIEHLAFRDYLRANADEAASYAELKRTLANRHRDERQLYTAAKTDFIQRCVRAALSE